MSLKSLIQRLLDSRTTPAQAVSANGMDLAHVTDVPWTEGDQMTYVAPSNGYIKLWIQAVAGSASDLGCDITVNNHRLIGTSVKTVSMESGLWMKVKKADSISFTKWGAPNPLQKVIEFIPSIGGGYNSFIRRALSCLRPSFNFSQRSSFRTNPSGSATKQCRSLTQQTKLNSRRQISTLSTLRQVMATSPCTRETTRGLNCTTETELSLVLHPAQRIVIYKWPQLRVQELTMWLANRMEALQKSLFPLLQQSERDALTGGALC